MLHHGVALGLDGLDGSPRLGPLLVGARGVVLADVHGRHGRQRRLVERVRLTVLDAKLEALSTNGSRNNQRMGL